MCRENHGVCCVDCASEAAAGECGDGMSLCSGDRGARRVAVVIGFLASDEASYVTGEAWAGGMEMTAV